MRSCEEMELLINLYLDDMLSSKEEKELLEHLATCPSCRACYQQLRAVKDALSTLEEPLPEQLHERIMTYVEQNTEKKIVPFRRRAWHRALAGVAACAVIAFTASHFMPDLKMNVVDSAGTSTPVEMGELTAPMAAPAAPSVSVTPTQQTEPNYAPSNAPVLAPTDSAPPMTMDGHAAVAEGTGQIAEDLPPLRKENIDEDHDYQVSTVCKWLKVSGKREDLPEWVDIHFVYEAELDGTSREYVEIAAFAEEYWADQLTACGFTVEELEGQDMVEDGEHILLIFFWE